MQFRLQPYALQARSELSPRREAALLQHRQAQQRALAALEAAAATEGGGRGVPAADQPADC